MQSDLTGVNDEQNRAQRDRDCILLHDFYLILLFVLEVKGKVRSFVFGGAACQHSTADTVMQSIRHRCVKAAFQWTLLPYKQ